ncbi:hypothetical protein [uncultured Pseudacidovorax sp.]|uniref:NfrA family protein n=1 Tax=uncultured Pseudacidovorax sp. TaxID=679313 RepID=UPI00260009B3|nr:hypothetical protein [uncultured Pseudacidovorax sp.]
MKPLHRKATLAMALAAAWPVMPALASVAPLAAEAPPGQDAGIQLRIAARLTLPETATAAGQPAPSPAPLPDTPQDALQMAELPGWRRRLSGDSLAMVRMARIEPRGMPSSADADPLMQIGGAPPPAPPQGPFPPGGPDVVLGAGARRLPTIPTRLDLAQLQEPPSPDAPAQFVRPGERRAAPAARASGPRTGRASRGGNRLRGAAWRLAAQGYRAYNRGRYDVALQRADAALRLRPDVARLQLLRVYSLQKLGRLDEAARSAAQAIAQGHGSPELQAALVNLRPAAPTAADGTPTTEAYRRGFPIATEAYTLYNDGKYAEAAKLAEQAVRIDPSQGPWTLLWLNALENQQRYDDVVQYGNVAMALGAPNKDAIMARMRLARQQIANLHAQAAYAALNKGRNREALAEARDAVRIAPDVASHRMLLIGVLQAMRDDAAAEKAATEALSADDENTGVQLLRAYLRQSLGDTAAAQKDIDDVLALDWITDDQRRNARLIGADLALAADQPDRARALVAPLPADDAQAQARLKRASRFAGWGPGADNSLTALAPIQLCRDTPYGTVCELAPWDDPGTDSPASRAYAAYGRQEYPKAIALARRAVAEQPDSEANQTLLTTTLASGTAQEQQEAMDRLNTALAAKPQDAGLLRQRAYLYTNRKQYDLALQDFVAARSTGEAPETNVLDEAYATAAVGNRPAAAAMLRQAIDDADAGKITLDKQQRFDTRSAVANFSREWGVNASVGYRGARSPSNALAGQPISVPGNATFSTVEAYWRPPEFLNSSNRTFEVYGRLSNTLHSGNTVTGAQVVDNPCGGTTTVSQGTFNSASGWPSTVGAIGARFTPDAGTNLTFGIERQFLLGTATRSGAINAGPASVRCALNSQAATIDYQGGKASGGWQAYMLYGFYDGTALRLDKSSWYTMEGYVQAGYTLLDHGVDYTERDASGNTLATGDGRLRRGQGFAAGEVRVGRSFLTSYSDRLVVFPHVTLAADWYSTQARVSGVPLAGASSFALAGNGSSWSAGAGIGVNLRYWLNEDRYNAQRSHADLSVQYRARLGGDADRAKGVFMTLSYSY